MNFIPDNKIHTTNVGKNTENIFKLGKSNEGFPYAYFCCE